MSYTTQPAAIWAKVEIRTADGITYEVELAPLPGKECLATEVFIDNEIVEVPPVDHWRQYALTGFMTGKVLLAGEVKHAGRRPTRTDSDTRDTPDETHQLDAGKIASHTDCQQ